MERYNFNPFEILGAHTYSDANNALSLTSQGVDGQKRKCNPQGFLQDKNGNIVSLNGKKVYPAELLVENCIPTLYTYDGRQFHITDCMGVFDNFDGAFPDKDRSGHQVNDRGYLVNAQGDVVDRDGQVLFAKSQTKGGEFPKFFSFTKFEAKRFMGVFDYDVSGLPVLKRDPNGKLLDKQSNLVNHKGYLVDVQGNIVDKCGNVMFERHLLQEGEVPELFRTHLREDRSELSNLMEKIDEEMPEGQEEDEARVQENRTPMRS